MPKPTPSEILATLPQFYGTVNWYRHPIARRYLYTDGVKYVGEACGAYWLIDSILVNQGRPEVQREAFQVWKLVAINNKGTLTCEDGNDREVYREDIPFTDFPLPEITLWLESNTLMLPSER